MGGYCGYLATMAGRASGYKMFKLPVPHVRLLVIFKVISDLAMRFRR
jgi:hypothetical protein